MKVTIVCHDVGPVSGMERQLVGLVEGLLARGVKVGVVARTCDIPSRDRVEHIRVRGPSRPFAIAFPWFALEAARAVRGVDSDVVQVTGCLAPIRADVVAIHFLHAHARPAGAGPRASAASLPYRINQGIAAHEHLAAERWQLAPGRQRAIVAVSGGLAEELRHHYPGAAAPVVIPNGIDLDAFSPGPADPGVRAELNPARRSHLAVFVGGGWEPKGLLHAIRALEHAPDWALAVVGSGDPQPFAAEASRLELGERVSFAGVRDDLPAIYRSADALLLPSAYETFSIVAHEAAACGCPVIATRVSGITDFARDGVTGFYVEREERSISSALNRLAELDQAATDAIGAAARAAVAERTTDAMVERYLGLYRELARPGEA